MRDELTTNTIDRSIEESKIEKIQRLQDLIADNKPLRSAYRDAGITLTEVFRLTSNRSSLSNAVITRLREDFADCLAISGLLVLQDADRDDIAKSSREADYRKWLAAKMLPSRYGDKQQVEVSGQIAIIPVINVGMSGHLTENSNSQTAITTEPAPTISLPAPEKKHA